MAAHPTGSPEALIARLDAARSVLGAEVRVVRQKLDFPTRIRRSVLTKPLVWLGGSAAFGLVASFFLRRRKVKVIHQAAAPEKKERGIIGFLLGSAFTLARPALEAWAMKELKNRFAPGSPPSPQARDPYPWRND